MTEASPPREPLLRWLAPLVGLLIPLLLLAYAPLRHAGFIWDDDDHFTANPYLGAPGGLITIWTSAKAVYYPLTLTSWWALRQLFGLNPLPYHALNLLLHAGNAVLLALVLRALRIPGARLAALLFALHPVHVTTVAWATELKNTQSGFFCLLALLAWLRFQESWAEGTPRWRAYAGALALFLPALLSKPSVTPLPGVLVVLCVWQLRRVDGRLLALTLPFFVLSAASAAWTIWEQTHHSNAQGPEWDQTFVERLQLSAASVWFYLGKLLWPDPLLFIHPRWEPSALAASWWLPVVALAFTLGALVLLAWEERKAPDWGCGVLVAALVFGGLLFPVLGFFRIYYQRFSVVSHHFQYLASMAPLALLAALAAEGARRAGQRPLLGAAAGALLLLGAWRIHGEVPHYRDEETLWRETIRRNPEAWIGWNNIGYLVAARGGPGSEAIAFYSEAIRLKPNYEEAFNNRAIAYLELGRPAQALADLEEALRHRPAYPEAFMNRGNALATLGRLDEAAASYESALRLTPADAEMHANLAVIHAMRKDFRAALPHLEAAVALAPENAEYRTRLEALRGMQQTSSGSGRSYGDIREKGTTNHP